jgi:hypothetical protein
MWCDIDNADYVREQLGITDCNIVARVDREVYGKDGLLKSHDIRYFLTSLDPDLVKPCDIQKFVRDHWQVETSLHFVKDRWWDEDRHYLSRPGLPEVWLALTNAALSVLRLVQKAGEPLTETAENFHYSPRKALHILGFNGI